MGNLGYITESDGRVVAEIKDGSNGPYINTTVTQRNRTVHRIIRKITLELKDPNVDYDSEIISTIILRVRELSGGKLSVE